MHLEKLASFSSVVALAMACAHAAEPPFKGAQDAPEGLAREDTTGQIAPSRAFAPDALYGDLVATLADADELPPPSARCLLAHTGTAYRFEGTANVALEPLPAAVEDLDGPIERARFLRVLTRRGSFGSVEATLGFVALTESPATRDAIVLAITDQALYVRGLDEPQPFIARTAAEAASHMKTRSPEASVYVAAEARVPLTRVYEVLRALATLPQPVVLASALPSDVILPRAREDKPNAQRCPEGLPATDAIEGDLPLAELMHGIEPLRAQAAECLRRADGPGTAGGRLTLALRIDARGYVTDTCIVTSDVADDALHVCVLTMARQLRFAEPSPRGVVDAELPIALRPDDVTRQAPVCETNAQGSIAE